LWLACIDDQLTSLSPAFPFISFRHPNFSLLPSQAKQRKTGKEEREKGKKGKGYAKPQQ